VPADADLDHHWPAIQSELRRAVSDATYQIWFAPLTARDLAGDTLSVAAPDRVARYVADRFGRVLQTCAAAVLGPEVEVEIVAASAAPAPRAAPGHDTPGRPADPGPNPKHTFDQFVIGEGNRLAHAAALAVAELPGQAYNPLFIYGPPGVGKTHLLHSIAGYVLMHGAGLNVRYTTIDDYTTNFVRSLQNGSIDHFKASYRGVDVLLIDDVQFLEDKTRTEEEFFHTFNALYETGSQLVLTSDRLPRDMAALEHRLRERFESGLVTDICAPDFQTRLTILRKRADHDGHELDPAALELLADRVPDNVRALEGALIRVIAAHSLTGTSVTPGFVDEVLTSLYPRSPSQRRSVGDVQAAACSEFSLSHDELVSPSRAARVAWPRQLAMYLSRELTDATLPAIGRQFGGRDHTTVVYACRRAAERLQADRSAYEAAQRLTDLLAGPTGDRNP